MIKSARILIISLVLISSVLSTFTIASAKFSDIYTCENRIEITYDQGIANTPLLPVNRTLNIPIQVKYYIQGKYAPYVAYKYYLSEVPAIINLFVESSPDWAEATITPNVMLVYATTEGLLENVSLIVTINRSSIAFDKGIIKINFQIPQMGAVKPSNFTREVVFTVGYIPSLGIDLPDGSVKSINPDETANFNIDLKNFGNDKTNVSFSILKIPKGWTIGYPPNIILGTSTLGESIEQSVSLNINPPYSLGYHNDKEIIKVLITPSNYKNSSLVGPTYELFFTVQSKGYSTPGFEGIFIIFIIIIFALVLKKRKRTNGGEDII